MLLPDSNELNLKGKEVLCVDSCDSHGRTDKNGQVFGYSILPISEEEFGELFTALFTVVTALWAWWKDNSWQS